MVFGKLDRHMQKNETRPPSHTTHKNKFKMDQRLSIRLETITILKEILGSKFSDIARSNILCDISQCYHNKFNFKEQRYSVLMDLKN